MATTYKYCATIELDDGHEVEATVSYEVYWGQPESGNYGPPEDYDPGCPDEIEDVKIIKYDGLFASKAIETQILLGIEAFYEDMINEAALTLADRDH